MNNNLINKPKTQTILSRSIRLLIFLTLISVEFAINNSTGLLSSASKNIKESLHINDQSFGMFGSMSGLGRVIGSSLFLCVVNKYNRKFIFSLFVITKGLLTICFKLTKESHILISTRFFIGITHMPPNIYIPIWIDQFGIQKYKTLFMTMIQVAYPGGKVIGYALHILFGEHNWQNGFVFEGIYLIIAGMFILLFPSKYFSSNLFVVKVKDANEEKVKIRVQKIPNESMFETGASLSLKPENNKMHNNNPKVYNECKEILTNIVFINGIISRAILYGVNTSLHYWISDYMRNVLHVNDNRIIFISYTIIAITGPIGGIFTSSIVGYCLGGYEHKDSALMLLILHIIACSCGIVIPFVNSLLPFSISTALYLIFNSAALPIVQGLIITSVSPNLKGTAFSIANLSTMLLTSGPAPVLYGIVNDKYKNYYPNMGMLVTMCCSFIAIVFIAVLIVGRYKIFNMKNMKGKTSRKMTNNLAMDVAGAVNEASIEMNTSLDKSKKEFDLDDLDEEDVEMALKK